jgi:hypothetical protein
MVLVFEGGKVFEVKGLSSMRARVERVDDNIHNNKLIT